MVLITLRRSCSLSSAGRLSGDSLRTTPWRLPVLFQILKSVATVALYAAMLIAILALWNNDAPQFIYVSF